MDIKAPKANCFQYHDAEAYKYLQFESWVPENLGPKNLDCQSTS